MRDGPLLVFCAQAPDNDPMQPAEENNRRRAWSSFWASGALHSCVGSFADNYDGAIGRFWRERFGRLQPGARVLDLATGNGALPRMLWDMFEGRHSLAIDAVDLARLAPRWFSPEVHAGISFHPGVGMEDLPFADASFDLVTSQYGLEYAQWPKAVDEAARVCRPGGSLAFVLHHADSVIVRVGREELSQQRVLLDSNGLLAAATGVLPWIGRARSGDPAASGAEARVARERYNTAMAVLGGLIEEEGRGALLVEAREFVHGVLGGRMGTEVAQQLLLLEDYRQAVADASVRTQEMLDCALDDTKVAGLAEVLRQRLSPGAVDVRALTQSEGLLGWGVVAG